MVFSLADLFMVSIFWFFLEKSSEESIYLQVGSGLRNASSVQVVEQVKSPDDRHECHV